MLNKQAMKSRRSASWRREIFPISSCNAGDSQTNDIFPFLFILFCFQFPYGNAIKLLVTNLVKIYSREDEDNLISRFSLEATRGEWQVFDKKVFDIILLLAFQWWKFKVKEKYFIRYLVTSPSSKRIQCLKIIIACRKFIHFPASWCRLFKAP